MGLLDLDAPRAIALRALITLLGMMVVGGLLVVLVRALRKKPKASAPGVPLGTRYLTLMVLVVLVLGPAFLGGWPFVAVIAAVAALGVREVAPALAASSLRVPALILALALVAAAALVGISALGPT